MTRNYGLSRRPDSVGAYGNPAGSHAPRGQRDSVIPFPAGSYRSADQFFEPVQIPKSLFDVAHFIGALVFLAGFGIGFFAFLFLLLITEIH